MLTSVCLFSAPSDRLLRSSALSRAVEPLAPHRVQLGCMLAGDHLVPVCYWYIVYDDSWHCWPDGYAAHGMRQGCALSPMLHYL